MKKLTAFILCFSIMLMLGGCGKDTNTEDKPQKSRLESSSNDSSSSGLGEKAEFEPITFNGGFAEGEALTYECPKLGFSVDYKKDWELVENTSKTEAFPNDFNVFEGKFETAITPAYFTETVPGYENTFTVNVHSNTENVNTEYYVEYRDGLFKALEQEYNSGEIMYIKLEKHAELMVYKNIKAAVMEYSTKAAYEYIHFINAKFVKDNVIFELSYAYLQEGADQEAMRRTFDNMLMSFNWK